jgi:hypothetical protein
MRFYLGTHLPSWLTRTDVPLFVSHRTLQGRRSDYPQALGPWALDSGGFTELSTHGRWLTSPDDYIRWVRRYRDEIGQLDWAAPQDWMCEPWITAKTGLTVTEHQRRTVANFLDLKAAAPDLPFVPVLQGWTLDDYLTCATMYEDAGVDLTAEHTVGVGSVCRRQSTGAIEDVMAALVHRGIQLHGFGVKTDGLGRYAWALRSADSMAWSQDARRLASRRRRAGLADASLYPTCQGHPSGCSNCMTHAMRWREQVLRRLVNQQPQLQLGA